MVSGEQVAGWLGRLVRIPSVTPSQAGPRAGTPGEGRIGDAVEQWFRELGAEVHREEVLPGRSNIYGLWKGQTERWAGIDVHLDTVGVEQMTGDPFSGETAGGKVHGRGAVDTKATLAVTLALLEELARRGTRPQPNLFVSATVDEEVDAHGAPACAAWLRRRGLVLDELAVAEPTLCGPVVGHKGVLRMEFEIEGVATHSSQPHFGKNAVLEGARLSLAFARENERLQEEVRSPTLGAPTLTVTIVRGGRGMNVVPDSCVLGIDRRLIDGERAEEVAAALTTLARVTCELPVTSRTLKQIHAFAQDPAHPWVASLAEWSGQAPAVVPYCTNAWAYPDAARACVVLGPGSIDQAHGAEEWVEVSELEKLAGIFARWWGVA